MIELSSVQAGYGGLEKEQILHIDHAVFEEGTITGIVGLNGSGKSTLLKTILGMTTVTGGTICIDGRKIASLGHKGRAREIAYLPQSYAAPAMDVYTLVSHGRFPYTGFSKVLGKKDEDLIEKALRLTDLWHIRQKNLSEISGGQRQRAYLAMAIAQDTRYLLLDEAAASLDIKHQLEVAEVLKKLAAEGKGVVLTCHDLPQSFSVCQRMYLMDQGTIVAAGTPAEIAGSPVLEQVMGAGLQKTENPESIYAWQLVKNRNYQ